MKEVLNEMAAYHLWANKLLLDYINDLPADQKVTEVKSSFSSLHTTLLHIYNAEVVWWQRVKLQERITSPAESFTGSTSELISEIFRQNKEWQDYIINLQDHVLSHELIYFNSKKEKFKQPIYQVLIHLFNHGTYHRGQLVTILRQLGVDKIPATDFIVWSRKKGIV
jgi:uncharacterized damage-inducible protein DinB